MSEHDDQQDHHDGEEIHDRDQLDVDIAATSKKCSKNCRTICENLFILMFEFTGTFMIACVF